MPIGSDGTFPGRSGEATERARGGERPAEDETAKHPLSRADVSPSASSTRTAPQLALTPGKYQFIPF